MIGATPELISGGIPDEAFNPIEGDERDYAKQAKSRNAFERKNKLMTEFGTVNPPEAAKEYASLDDFTEKSPEDVEKKKKKYAALTESDSWRMSKVLSDVWTAAFFWELNGMSNPPTDATLRIIRGKGTARIEPELFEKVETLANNNSFFIGTWNFLVFLLRIAVLIAYLVIHLGKAFNLKKNSSSILVNQILRQKKGPSGRN